MTLREFLETLQSNQKIRIGCRPGIVGYASGGFIYQGSVKDFKSWPLEERYIRDLSGQISRHMSWHVRDKESKRRLLHNLVDRYCDFVPFWDREVLDFYQGQYEPETVVIIIPGLEQFFDYTPEYEAKTFVNSAVESLIEAVYKSLISELIDTRNEGHAQALALAIKKNDYGFFTNPQGVLDACRKERRRRYGK